MSALCNFLLLDTKQVVSSSSRRSIISFSRIMFQLCPIGLAIKFTETDGEANNALLEITSVFLIMHSYLRLE